MMTGADASRSVTSHEHNNGPEQQQPRQMQQHRQQMPQMSENEPTSSESSSPDHVIQEDRIVHAAHNSIAEPSIRPRWGWCPCKWSLVSLLPIPMATCYVILTASAVWVYITMRRITLSTEKFEAVPCYIVALQLLLCAGVMSLFHRRSFRLHRTAIKFAGAIFAIAAVLLIVAIVSSCWLADKQEQYNICLYNPRMLRCTCRRDNNTLIETGWYTFEAVESCAVLDALYRWQVMTLCVHACGVFVCIVSILLFYQLWHNARQWHAQMRHHRLHPYYTATQHAIYDWDSWLHSQSFLQRLVTELRHVRLPPSYDTSQRHHRQQPQYPPATITGMQSGASPNDAPPAYVEETVTSNDANTIRHSTILTVTGDETKLANATNESRQQHEELFVTVLHINGNEENKKGHS